MNSHTRLRRAPRLVAAMTVVTVAVAATLGARAQPPQPPQPVMGNAAPIPADRGVAPPAPAMAPPDRGAPPRSGGRGDRPAAPPRGPAAPPPPEGGPVALAPTEGKVTGYLLSPEADVAGVLLDNGREVRVPPHLGPQLAALVKPGDRVRFSGQPAPTPGAAAPTPWTITAVGSGRTLTDTPPTTTREPVPPAAQGQSALQAMKASGTVRRVLTGPRGEPNGVVLDNGTQVAVPPQAPQAADRLLTVGTHLDVEGYGRTTAYGTAVQATVLSRPGEAPMTIFAPAAAVPPMLPVPPVEPAR